MMRQRFIYFLGELKMELRIDKVTGVVKYTDNLIKPSTIRNVLSKVFIKIFFYMLNLLV